MDQPLVWYEGSGTTDRRFLSSDERGSIVSVTDGSGALLAINSYDEHGIPGPANVGRFQFTGQAWLPELGLQYSKSRIYSPTLGRFLQTDPIGYGEGMNMYAYVRNDPANFTDPLGLCSLYGGPSGGTDPPCNEMNNPPWECDSFGCGYYQSNGMGGAYWVPTWTSRDWDNLASSFTQDYAAAAAAAVKNAFNFVQRSPDGECTEFQKLAEQAGDSFSSTAGVTSDLALVSLGSAGIAAATGAEPLALLLTDVSIHMASQSLFWGSLAAGSYVLSGNSPTVILEQAKSYVLKKIMPFASDPVRDAIASRLPTEGNRCP